MIFIHVGSLGMAQAMVNTGASDQTGKVASTLPGELIAVF
jgi:hypothetical protein